VAAAIGAASGLIVLDGAEHVADDVGVLRCACSTLVRVRLLSTARVPLGLGAERIVALSPLPVPSDDEPIEGTALELLIDRAGLDQSSLDDETLGALRTACVSTAGVPMLIELTSRILEVADLGSGIAPDQRSESHAAAINDAISTSMEMVDDSTKELLFDAAVLSGGVSEETASRLLAIDPSVARRAFASWPGCISSTPMPAHVAALPQPRSDPARSPDVRLRSVRRRCDAPPRPYRRPSARCGRIALNRR
jgi:hypothetical protein